MSEKYKVIDSTVPTFITITVVELAGSIGGSVSFAGNAFQSEVTWFSLYAGIGLGTPSASVNGGASKTYPWHLFHFKN